MRLRYGIPQYLPFIRPLTRMIFYDSYRALVYAKGVWQWIVEFFSKIPVSHLGHDAVIEIMIALLGVMIAVLTLVAALFAVVIAVVGIFGYQTIRDEATKRATATAAETAEKTANAYMLRWAGDGQASGLSESQSEPAKERQVAAQPPKNAQKKSRRKATSDHNLKEGAE